LPNTGAAGSTAVDSYTRSTTRGDTIATMDEERRELLGRLHEVTLEAAVERLLELGVLDAATLSTRCDEQARVWRERSSEGLGDELEALRRQAVQQRRHAAAQVAEARRQRHRTDAAREAIADLDQVRLGLSRRREMARAELAEERSALDAAHRALAAALAALTLLDDRTEPPGDAALTIESQRFGDRLVLCLEGEIDIATAPQFNAALDAARATGVDELWVDLVGVSFMDSTGIAALLRVTHALPGPRRLAVICPDGPARRALELCGVGHLLQLHADRPVR
jgi:anti-sigma B factor antagonist